MLRCGGSGVSAQPATRLRVKRMREEAADAKRECPVCMNEFTEQGVHTETWPFRCVHGICRACDREMFAHWDDRCPFCRTDRKTDLLDPGVRGPRSDGVESGTVLFFPLPSDMHDYFRVQVDAAGDRRARGPGLPLLAASRGSEHPAGHPVDAELMSLVSALVSPNSVSVNEFLSRAQRARVGVFRV